MDSLVGYLALALLPAGVFWGAGQLLDRLATQRPRRREVASAPPTTDRLMADLVRLEREYRAVQGSDVPARAVRLRTLALAYDDVLCACCQVLGLPRPGSPPLAASSRLQVEAALAQRGLVW